MCYGIRPPGLPVVQIPSTPNPINGFRPMRVTILNAEATGNIYFVCVIDFSERVPDLNERVLVGFKGAAGFDSAKSFIVLPCSLRLLLPNKGTTKSASFEINSYKLSVNMSESQAAQSHCIYIFSVSKSKKPYSLKKRYAFHKHDVSVSS